MTVSRPPRDKDVPALAEIRNDLATQYALLAAPRPNTLADVRAWLDRRMGDAATLFAVVADERDDAVGFTQVVDIDETGRHGLFGIAIDRRRRNQGHGRAALDHVLNSARADGRLDKLMLHVAADNGRAHRLYRSAGFVDVGVYRRHYRAPDGWHDVAVMERFLSETP